MYDPIIHGKDVTERIVSIEIQDDAAELFIEQKDGSILSQFVPNRYWILSSEKINNKNWVRLKGDLNYKWGLQFESKAEFRKYKYFWGEEYDIYAISDEKESLMVNRGQTYYKGMAVKDVSILSFDIESTGLKHDDSAKVLLISNTFRKNGQIERKLFAYDDYETEKEFFDEWCKWVREKNPSIMVGHNVFSFDFPYINFCAKKAGTSLSLGRDNSYIKFNNYESKFRKDQSNDLHYKRAFIYGREIVDTYFLSIKYDVVAKKYDSYGLKNIIKSEGLEKKDRTFYDASQIRFNYLKPEEWAKIKEYCKEDSDDSLTLFDIMAPSQFYFTQSVPKSFQSVCYSATGAQINSIMVRSYLQNGHSLPKATHIERFEGAISSSTPGIYANIFKVDVKSLYPSIILQYKIYNKEKDPEGNFLKMMEYFTNERLKNKEIYEKTGDMYYKDMSEAQKIAINSGYGFMGATGLLFNSLEDAKLITQYGREIITKAIEWAKAKTFSIANVDTDSISFSNAGKPISIEERKELLKDLNSNFPEKIIFADDGYYPKMIVIATKNYILKNEKGQVKIKGSGLKASTKEPALKEFINDLITHMLDDNDDLETLYNKYVKEIMMGIKDIKRWSSRKTITEAVLNPKRTTEQKILDCIKETEYKEGDRIWTFFKEDSSLSLVEHFTGDYSKDKLLAKLFETVKIFDTVLNIERFPNYKLKGNKDELEVLLNGR